MKNLFPLTIFVVFSVVYSFIFIIKHDFQFQTFGWDSGFFDQVIWKAGYLDFGKSTVISHSLMSSNFEPILFLLAPLLRIVSDIRILFVIQATVAVSAVIPIYFLATKITSSIFFSVAIGLAYVFLVPFQHAILDGFTQSFFVAPFLAWAFYFLEGKNLARYWLMVLGLILTKEEFSLFLVPLGLVIFFHYKLPKLSLVTIIIGIVTFWFLIYVLNPLISSSDRNWAHFSTGYGEGGATPVDVIYRTITDPISRFGLLIDNPKKIETVKMHFLSFSLLPIFAPFTLIPLVYEYFVRFINTTQEAKWLGHDFDFGVILSVGAIYAASFLKPRLNLKILSMFLLLSTFLADICFHGPINSLFKEQFYREEQWAKNNHLVLKMVPDKSSVSANNSLVPHLSHRNEIYQFPKIGDAQFVVVDLHNGLNAYVPIDWQQTKNTLEDLIITGKYREAVRIGEAVILEKI